METGLWAAGHADLTVRTQTETDAAIPQAQGGATTCWVGLLPPNTFTGDRKSSLAEEQPAQDTEVTDSPWSRVTLGSSMTTSQLGIVWEGGHDPLDPVNMLTLLSAPPTSHLGQCSTGDVCDTVVTWLLAHNPLPSASPCGIYCKGILRSAPVQMSPPGAAFQLPLGQWLCRLCHVAPTALLITHTNGRWTWPPRPKLARLTRILIAQLISVHRQGKQSSAHRCSGAIWVSWPHPLAGWASTSGSLLPCSGGPSLENAQHRVPSSHPSSQIPCQQSSQDNPAWTHTPPTLGRANAVNVG